LEDRDALTRTGKARAFPFEPPKTGGANRKAADHVAVTAAFVAELRRASKPDSVFATPPAKYIQRIKASEHCVSTLVDDCLAGETLHASRFESLIFLNRRNTF
jgi:hypothetical protein